MVIGFIAAPDNPPVVLPRRDLRVCGSRHNEGYVFATTTASAPDSSTALAITSILPTTGDNFTQRGRFDDRLAALVTSAASTRSVPYSSPPCFTLGQEMFSSYAVSPSASLRIRITSTYSSTERPKTFARIAVSYARSSGSFSVTKVRTPMFWSPIAFTMPPGVSHIRGLGAPAIGSSESPFTTIPPRAFRFTSWANSSP